MTAKFRTTVKVPTADRLLQHSDQLLGLGSCFAMETGSRLKDAGFSLVLNPFGIVYNPVSLASGLDRMLQADFQFKADGLFEHNGLWHSPEHHGSFSHVEKPQALAAMNAALNAGRAQLAKSTVLLLTLGSSQVFRSVKSGEIVANNHKLPAHQFTEEQLSTKQIIAALEAVFKQIFASNEVLHIVLTVSPVRHRRNGFHENQLSKARLLLAAEALCELFPGRISYFPAYEIVLDELRDYRFYDNDMLHPNETATNYIWEVFEQTYFDEHTRQLAREISQIKKSLRHRPLKPGSQAHQDFLKQTQQKIIRLGEQQPEIDFAEQLKNIGEALEQKYV